VWCGAVVVVVEGRGIGVRVGREEEEEIGRSICLGLGLKFNPTNQSSSWS